MHEYRINGGDTGSGRPDGEPRTEPLGEPVDERVSEVTAGPGGVMTDEVGVVTGELTLRTERHPDGRVVVRVQYRGADEWYAVTGGATRLADPDDLDAVHSIAVGLLDRPLG
jgi:hypothetical protein